MIEPSVEQFAKKLVALMRDATIRQLDEQSSPYSNSARANAWRAAKAVNTEGFYLRVIADAVDTAIFNLLFAIDQEILRLYCKTEDGRVIDLAKAGNGTLAADFSTGYWTKKYSEKRHYHNEEPNTETPDIAATEDIESFMAVVVKTIRDSSIMFGDHAVRKDAKGPTALRQQKARTENEAEFLSMIIADSVDQAVFYFLWAIDYDNELYLYYVNDEGEKIDLCREGQGEMYGWYAGNDWKKEYSKERWYSDFDEDEIADSISKL